MEAAIHSRNLIEGSSGDLNWVACGAAGRVFRSWRKSREEPMRRPYEQAHACAMSGDFETESAA
jgi:hypothetical protein